jgi:hypothetical protein
MQVIHLMRAIWTSPKLGGRINSRVPLTQSSSTKNWLNLSNLVQKVQIPCVDENIWITKHLRRKEKMEDEIA